MNALSQTPSILLVIDNRRLRQLYRGLLELRGHDVRSTSNPDEADRLLRETDLQLVIVDEDALDTDLREWSDNPDRPRLVTLTMPTPTDPDDTPLPDSDDTGADLVLHKPLSPMELGIQVDHLLGDSGTSTLEEDSELEDEFDDLRRQFVTRLDTELERVADQYNSMLDHGDDHLGRYASRLRRTVDHLCTASRQYGFPSLADELDTLRQLAESLMVPEPRLDDETTDRGRRLVDDLRARCRKLQLDVPHSPDRHTDDETRTLLVVDPDPDYREQLQQLGDQFILRIRTARTLREARRRVRTPLLTGVMLSMSAVDSDDEIRSATDSLRRASPLDPLPLALVGPDRRALDDIRTLWAGVSTVLTKPMTAAKFARTLRRLSSVRRAQKSSILVIEPDGSFARHLEQQLDTRHVAVHHLEATDRLLEPLRTHRPDLLVVDTHVQSVSSFDLCRTIRSIPRWQQIPVAMITDRDDPEVRIAAYDAGVDDVLVRGLSADEIRARIGVRLDRSRRIRERTERDELTGLLTRRAFLERLAARLSEVSRHDRPLTFTLLDLDHFKSINDDYGHPTGDRVLETLGRLLRDRFRAEDLRARWGGEEFAVVLVDETASTTRRALDRIRTELANLEFDAPSDDRFRVTFSAGIAVYPDDGHDAETLFETADQRLLEAKQRGRNTIVAEPR